MSFVRKATGEEGAAKWDEAHLPGSQLQFSKF